MVSIPILLDYQSSTPCSKEVVESMLPYWTEIFANPSNKSNLAGISASAILEVSREKIYQVLNLKNKKVIFTSGATESNNLALLGFARNYFDRTGKCGHIITLKTEHLSVLEPLNQLKKEGFSITEIIPKKDGLISKEAILNAIRPDTFLVSIMFANNEIGVIQPLNEISNICKSKNLSLHTDAAQCLGYIPMNSLNSTANMITFSSHKIYGPKGVGLLIIDEQIEIKPLVSGGSQEFGFRSGTIPLPLIVGFTKAIELAVQNLEINVRKLLAHRDYLCKGLLEKNSGIYINGSMLNRLPHNLNFTISNVRGSLLHKELKPKIVCSSGSACSNGKPSHVLLALGRSLKEAEASIRLSIGLSTTFEEIDNTLSVFGQIVQKLRD